MPCRRGVVKIIVRTHKFTSTSRAATTSPPPNAIGESPRQPSGFFGGPVARGVDDVALDLLQVLRRRADGSRRDDLRGEFPSEDGALHRAEVFLAREAAT